MEKRVVGIVGVGHVGAHVAYTLGMMGVADEILLCDIKEKKLISECNDLNDAVSFMPNRVLYKIADLPELRDCDIIVNAVGDIELCRNFNRDDELKNSVLQVAKIIPRIMDAGFNGIFVNITNPCDLITCEIASLSGLPRSQVLGTGTLLDSARLQHALSDVTGLDSRSFNAYMIGQHGDHQFIPWSMLNFGGMDADQFETARGVKFQRDIIHERAVKGGWITVSGKWCTEYGIAGAAAALVRTILHDEKRILPCSVELDGEYGQHDLFVGVPAVIGKDGVEKVIELPLNEEERARFSEVVKALKVNMEKARTLILENKEEA
ncbi:lactate/malate family dehydrogenase [Acidaminococcus sp.]|uniref:lactate/malate family dehydrogenase n=1 Tax=Acidaminococcus sp. TaxID=1872103 RepID=UPI003D7CC4C6